MSECVVRMEMPENCAVCPFVTEYSRCVFLGMYAIDEERRADNCPIVCSIPEGHGRMVDADALKEKAVHYSETEYHFDHDAVEMDDIDDAPTIVPAERSKK